MVLKLVHLTLPLANPAYSDVIASAWTATEAIRSVPDGPEREEQVDVVPDRGRQRQRRLTDDEVLQIVEENESGESQPVLAERYGVHRTTIMRALEREGVRARRKVRKMTERQVEEAARLYQSGLTLAGVAGRLGLGSSTVRRELTKAGVEVRSRGRS